MVVLTRTMIKLEDGTEIPADNNSRILAMDWRVADNQSMMNPVLKSFDDKVNLASIAFPDILDPNIKWYGQARALIKDKGWTKWGNLDVLNYQQVTDVTTQANIPSRVSTPVLTTNSNADNHDATLFVITATGFSVVGNATHVATSYFIEDIDNKVIWSSLYNSVDKNNIEFRSMILKNNSVYRIRAMFHSSSNDVSSIAAYTIRVGSDNELDLLTYLDNVDYREDTSLEVVVIDDSVTSIVWQIVGITNNYAELVFNQTTTGTGFNKVTIPANLLVDDTCYTLKFKPNRDDGSWKYIPFKTMNASALITQLEIYPLTINTNHNTNTKLTITTDADDYTFVISDDKVLSFDKATSTVKPIKEGTADIVFTAQAVNKYSKSVRLSAVITKDTTSLTVTPTVVELILDPKDEELKKQVLTVETDAEDTTFEIKDDTIVSYDKTTKTITGLLAGSTRLTIKAQKFNTEEVSQEVAIKVWDVTELTVTPETIDLTWDAGTSIGSQANLTVTTSATDYQYAIADNSIVAFDKVNGILTAKAVGTTTMNITATELNKKPNKATVTINVTAV